MSIGVREVENGKILWVKVNSDRDDNERLWIFTGVAVLETWHRSNDDSWGRDSTYISMAHIHGAPEITGDQWIDGTVIASPAAFQLGAALLNHN